MVQEKYGVLKIVYAIVAPLFPALLSLPSLLSCVLVVRPPPSLSSLCWADADKYHEMNDMLDDKDPLDKAGLACFTWLRPRFKRLLACVFVARVCCAKIDVVGQSRCSALPIAGHSLT